jgi:hypothetical protein
MLLPRFIAAEKKVAIVAFQIAAFADLENNIQILHLHGLHGLSIDSFGPGMMRSLSKPDPARIIHRLVASGENFQLHLHRLSELNVQAEAAARHLIDMSVDEILSAFQIRIVRNAIHDLLFNFGHLALPF